jgi:radical SAM superfamily enzyme YgiQ (UPF0313 family)
MAVSHPVEGVKRPATFHVCLIKPSKYDDEGFVIRHWRGVLPNNTLACLHGLTEDIRRRELLGNVDLRVRLLDEAVMPIPIEEIASLSRSPGQQVVAALVGVQTNQFCRAADIAFALRREEVPVIIGGFHVSGMMAMFSEVSPEIRQLLAAGATVVAGEVEHRWSEILRDALKGALKPVYNFLGDPPDLSCVPGPIIDKRYMRKFAASKIATLDCSRGCPFRCSFCTIINVQGRKNRHRSAECVAETMRHWYREAGINFYFITDDNFARNPEWEAIFDRLIQLRELEKIPIDFMIQVDALCHTIPRFVRKAARAGCASVFIGVESLNPRNLQDAGKTQNNVAEYGKLIDAWHEVGVATQVGYIIGLPHDTEESVRNDVDRLIRDVRPDRAAFFMMTPLPGSQDHRCMIEAGAQVASDYNLFDSCHETTLHPAMKEGAWTRAYRNAWERFYSFENMKTILSRATCENYWGTFRGLFWYKHSACSEGIHPMLSGFLRLKDRTTRRAGYPLESPLTHLRRRVPEIARFAWSGIRLTLEMEELWLQTRKRSELEQRVLAELSRMGAELRRKVRVSDLQTAYAKVKAYAPTIKVPSRFRLLVQEASLIRISPFRETRSDLAAYWREVEQKARRGRIKLLLQSGAIALNALREVRLMASFLIALAAKEDYEPSRW